MTAFGDYTFFQLASLIFRYIIYNFSGGILTTADDLKTR